MGRIVRRPAGSVAPLSPAQRRLWILHQLDPGTPLSNRPVALRRRGPLDRGRLAGSLTEIVRRHEALRTVFPEHDGTPVQSVRPPAPVPLDLTDLTSHPDPEAEARRQAAIRAREPFDLATGPLIRAQLLRLGPEDHVLLLLMHHIVFDGWSANLLRAELDALGREPTGELPELALQCADVAAWQAGRDVDAHVAYWREQLDGLPVVELPADHDRPDAMVRHGARHHLTLPAALGLALKELSRRERVTLFMTLLAAFQVLVARHSRLEDVPVGVPVAGRTRPETEPLIGCFMNTLVLRTDLSGRPSFRQLLGRVREVTLDAFDHQEAPFERVVEVLRPDRQANRWPLAQVMFHLRNLPRRPPADDAGLWEPFPFDPGIIGGLDLSLEVEDTPGGLECTFTYATELFEPGTIARLSRRFALLLDAAVTDPDRPVGRLPLLPEDEHETVVRLWNDTDVDLGSARLVHELFEEQAATNPEAPAVWSEAGAVTYGELDRRADRVAVRLTAAGVGPDVPVGICADRSVAAVAAMLGVLKAGGALLALDPTHPSSRLDALLSDSGAPLVLADDRHAVRLHHPGAAFVPLDGPAGPGPHGGAGPRTRRPSADHLAYVIYTSGSTGTPKGVLVPHRALRNHLLWRRRAFPVGPGDSVLHKTSVAFDDAVWELFEPLVSGARLVLAGPGSELDPAALVELIAGQGVTAACFVPSLLRALLEEPRLHACTSLHRVTTGGERLPPEVAAAFLTRLPTATLHNGYGPTETTVAATFWDCGKPAPGATVPIGRPVANTQVYVLDDELAPVPIGVTGELCIGGEGVARGYLHRPEATARSFVADPFRSEPGRRLYRSGDLGRFRPDGTLEFGGRLDDQVKVRGARVEPGEVAAVLERHPAVREAAVVAVDGGRGMRLVAYVVPTTGVPLDPTGLRRFLADRLPRVMVPGSVVAVDTLPRTAAGKLDRRALPPIAERPPATTHAPPSTDCERAVAEVWCDVLEVDGIGLDDDFFDLGGHSLLATRMLARVRTTLGVDACLGVVFEHPTLRGFAAALD